MKIQNLLSADWSLALKTIIAVCACCYVAPLTAAAQTSDCTPVAYLFRHAEETAISAGDIDQDTLEPEGDRHAYLYISMIQRLQSRLNLCPVLPVYAMARKNAPNAVSFPNGIGTTNPFFTAKPLFNAAVAVDDCVETGGTCGYPGQPEQIYQLIYDPFTSTEFMITERPGVVQTDGLLYEYLPYAPTREQLSKEVKDWIGINRSVAFFWSSQGLNQVATLLGQPIPAYAGNKVPARSTDYKAPRNSIFIFSDYNQTSGTFGKISIGAGDKLQMTTGQFIQCFNYLPGKGFDTIFPGTNQIAYYCKYNENLATDSPRIPVGQLSRLKGAICDANKLAPYGNPGVYIGYGVENGSCF